MYDGMRQCYAVDIGIFNVPVASCLRLRDIKCNIGIILAELEIMVPAFFLFGKVCQDRMMNENESLKWRNLKLLQQKELPQADR